MKVSQFVSPSCKLSILVLCIAFVSIASTSRAALLEFSVANGYNFPFSTPVWTYNTLWTFDGGPIGSNYVAQHGYNAGFALTEPFALVIRNDSAPANYRFHYDFQPVDVAGFNPANLNNTILALTFDVCSTVFQNSQTANNAPMVTMKFGGTAVNPGMTLAFSDSNQLMYSNGAGNLIPFNGYTLNGFGWDRVTLKLNFMTDTYDLSIDQMTGNGITGSSTYTPINNFSVVTGMPFTNALTDMQQLYFETFTDPEDGGGWHKMFLDNFTSMNMGIPEPATGLMLLLGGIGAASALRRRHDA
jgi:hypothetical protein